MDSWLVRQMSHRCVMIGMDDVHTGRLSYLQLQEVV